MNLEATGLVEDNSYWTFSDIFEENYFPFTPFHGFGLLNLYGIAKPAYRAYQLLHRLGNKRLAVDGIHSSVDGWVIKGDDEIAVYCTNWNLPRHPTTNEHVRIFLIHAPRPAAANINSLKTGSAISCRLRAQAEPAALQYADGITGFEFTMPPQATAGVVIELKSRRKSRRGSMQHNMSHSADAAPKGGGAQC